MSEGLGLSQIAFLDRLSLLAASDLGKQRQSNRGSGHAEPNSHAEATVLPALKLAITACSEETSSCVEASSTSEEKKNSPALVHRNPETSSGPKLSSSPPNTAGGVGPLMVPSRRKIRWKPASGQASSAASGHGVKASVELEREKEFAAGQQEATMSGATSGTPAEEGASSLGAEENAEGENTFADTNEVEEKSSLKNDVETSRLYDAALEVSARLGGVVRSLDAGGERGFTTRAEIARKSPGLRELKHLLYPRATAGSLAGGAKQEDEAWEIADQQQALLEIITNFVLDEIAVDAATLLNRVESRKQEALERDAEAVSIDDFAAHRAKWLATVCQDKAEPFPPVDTPAAAVSGACGMDVATQGAEPASESDVGPASCPSKHGGAQLYVEGLIAEQEKRESALWKKYFG